MAEIKKLDKGQVVLSNAKYLHVTPWTDADTPGNQTYDFVSIVGDTLSFTPDDNTVNEKISEFTAAPLFETVTLGKTQFAATCVDAQNDVLTTMFGWEKVGENGSAVAPSVYKDLYVTLEVGFANEKLPVVVVPKLKLNGKLIISNLKTGTGESTLAGTAYDAGITVASLGAKTSSMAFVSPTDKTYTIASKVFTVGEGVGAGA